MPEAERELIFERFYRAANSEGLPGLGLGLYMARAIVERHGGALTARSAFGAGSAFQIDLPAHQPEIAANRTRMQPPVSADAAARGCRRRGSMVGSGENKPLQRAHPAR